MDDKGDDGDTDCHQIQPVIDVEWTIFTYLQEPIWVQRTSARRVAVYGQDRRQRLVDVVQPLRRYTGQLEPELSFVESY